MNFTVTALTKPPGTGTRLRDVEEQPGGSEATPNNILLHFKDEAWGCEGEEYPFLSLAQNSDWPPGTKRSVTLRWRPWVYSFMFFILGYRLPPSLNLCQMLPCLCQLPCNTMAPWHVPFWVLSVAWSDVLYKSWLTIKQSPTPFGIRKYLHI